MEYIIGIGSNLGDKIKNIKSSILYIKQYFKILSISSIFVSKALLKSNYLNQWDKEYFNLVILIDCKIHPVTLLRILKLIELTMGRIDYTPIWSPRIIDLDILMGDGLTLYTPKLKIPHLEFLNRSFTLIPSKEIAPNMLYSNTSSTIRDLYHKLKDDKPKNDCRQLYNMASSSI